MAAAEVLGEKSLGDTIEGEPVGGPYETVPLSGNVM